MKLKTKQAVYGTVFIIPFSAGCLVFYFIPFLISLYYSVTKGFGDRTFAGADNYIRLFQNEAFLLALKNTVVFLGIAVPLLMLASLLMGVFVHSLGKAGRLLQTFLLLPMIVPIASVIKVWQILFDNQGGVLNHLLSALNMEPQQFLKGGWAMAAVILIFIWKNAGYLSILYAVALSAVPVECVEAARIDGGGRGVIFRKIILPFLRPTTFFVMLLSVINGFKIFREVFLLAGEYPDTSIYFIQHYMNNNFYNLNYQNLSAASTILTAIIVLAVAVLFQREKKIM